MNNAQQSINWALANAHSLELSGGFVKTNEIKKGHRVLLSNGWYATMLDNLRGQTRLAMVEGMYTEAGSVYAHDIVAVQDKDNADLWHLVQHTASQKKLRGWIEEQFNS